MAIDFEWNGKRWEAKKVRRKAAWHEHKGVALYDRERMRQTLAPIVHSRGFDGYSAAPSWASVPGEWGGWDTLPAGYFHQCGADSCQPCEQVASARSPQAACLPVDSLDDPPIAQTDDYTLERCHVETVCSYRNPVSHRPGQPEFIRRSALYRWELSFADGATFRFVSRAIAEAALSQLLKIRSAKHPRPKFGKQSLANDCVLFTDRRLAKLQADMQGLPINGCALALTLPYPSAPADCETAGCPRPASSGRGACEPAAAEMAVA